MKKFIFLLILFFCYAQAIMAQTNCIDALTKSLSDLIEENIKKKSLPENSKIAVLLFVGSDSESDTLISRLGIRISQQLSADLSLNLFNSKTLKSKNYQVLFPESKKDILLETSQKFFRPPTSSGEESNFYTSFYNNLKPDYYLTGKYKIEGNFAQISLFGVSLQSDPYNVTMKTNIPVASVSEKISANELSDIKKLHIIDLDGVCSLLASDIKLKTSNLKEPIYIENFLLLDTKMTSPFSRRFVNSLKQKLVASGIEIISPEDEPAGNKVKKYVISGSFWEESSSLKIIAELKSTETNKTMVSTVRKLPVVWLEDNKISIKPDNFETAKQNEELFKKNQVNSSGGLLLEVNTNKGNTNLIYAKGDMMKISLKANMECYVRFIYYFADNTKVLLLDNYHITAENINKWIELPNKFMCAEPFGVEFMQSSAQQKPFDPLSIKMQGGYKFILDNNNTISEINRRGFLEIEQFSEVNIPITTVKE